MSHAGLNVITRRCAKCNKQITIYRPRKGVNSQFTPDEVILCMPCERSTASDDTRPTCPSCGRRVVKLIYDVDDNIKRCHDCCMRPCE